MLYYIIIFEIVKRDFWFWGVRRQRAREQGRGSPKNPRAREKKAVSKNRAQARKKSSLGNSKLFVLKLSTFLGPGKEI